MNTADPTAWPAHSFLEFTDCPFDVLLSCLSFLDEGNPTYPFISGKWRQTVPLCTRAGV